MRLSHILIAGAAAVSFSAIAADDQKSQQPQAQSEQSGQHSQQSQQSQETVKQVQAEREKNADVRRPLRLVTERKEWIDTLRNSGLTKKSARRRVQRWINTLHLSAEEINASLARGRVVRRPRPSQPS